MFEVLHLKHNKRYQLALHVLNQKHEIPLVTYCMWFVVCNRVTLAFTGVGLLVFLTSIIGLLPSGK